MEDETFVDFGRQLGDVAPVVAESVLSRRISFANGALRPTSGADIEEAFGALPHVAVETRIALSESEAYLGTVLLPLATVTALLGAAGEAEPAAADEAAALREQMEAKAPEFVSLLTLMLFTDSPLRAEISVSEVRGDSIEESVGMLVDSAGDPTLYRLDADLQFGEDERGALTLILPAALPSALVRGLTGAGKSAANASGTRPRDEEGNEPAPRRAIDLDDDEDDEGSIPISPLQFPSLQADAGGGGPPQPLDLILDVTMRVSVELGRATLTVQEILALGPGSVVELDKLAGEPVDILVNERLIARGEVVMVDENFGVRVTEILSPGANAAAMRRAA